MKKIFLSGLGITVALGIGRILGFFRDVLVINMFGKTYVADMAVLILTTQDLLLNFFLGSAFTVALMSIFAGRPHKIGEIMVDFHKILSGIILLAIILLVANMGAVIQMLAPGLPLAYQNQVQPYLIVSIFSIPFTVYAAITTATLNYKESFVLPSLGTTIFNFVVCFCLIASFFVHHFDPFYMIAVGVVLGAVLRWWIQLKNLGFRRRDFISSPSAVNFGGFFKKYAHVMLATSSLYIIPIIARSFASKQGMGQISIFNFISKLIEFPISLFSGIVVTLLTPRLAAVNDQWRMIAYSSLCLFLFFTLVFLGAYLGADYMMYCLLAFSKFSEINLNEITTQFKMATYLYPVYGVVFFLVTALATTRYAKFYGLACLILNILFYVLGEFYITSITLVYGGLIALYSILFIIGFTIIALQLRPWRLIKTFG